jgi:DNA replication protein DnaC
MTDAETTPIVQREPEPSELAALLANGPTPHPCPKCGAEIFVDCAACGAADDARAARAERYSTLAKSLPAFHRELSFDRPESLRCVKMRAPLETARTLANERLLIVRGDSRTGKTALIAALLRERIRLGGEVGLFIRAAKLASATIKHRAGAGDAQEIIEARRASLLVIDDLGTNDQHPMSELSELLFDRFELPHKATWITTWLSREQIGDRYGGGIGTRYWDEGRTIFLSAEKGAKS